MRWVTSNNPANGKYLSVFLDLEKQTCCELVLSESEATSQSPRACMLQEARNTYLVSVVTMFSELGS